MGTDSTRICPSHLGTAAACPLHSLCKSKSSPCDGMCINTSCCTNLNPFHEIQALTWWYCSSTSRSFMNQLGCKQAVNSGCDRAFCVGGARPIPGALGAGGRPGECVQSTMKLADFGRASPKRPSVVPGKQTAPRGRGRGCHSPSQFPDSFHMNLPESGGLCQVRKRMIVTISTSSAL